MFAKYTWLLLTLLFCAPLACAGPAASPSAPSVVAPADTPLRDESSEEPLGTRLARAPLTVLVFFGPECPVQKAHDARVRELVSAFGPRGVSFAAVVSSRGADMAAVRADAKTRGLAMPVLEDRDAALANALGVDFSTHALVIDRERRVLYSGAIDSDRTHLTGSAEPYLKNAIDAALAGRAVAKPRTEPLGCPLAKD